MFKLTLAHKLYNDINILVKFLVFNAIIVIKTVSVLYPTFSNQID